VKKLALVPILCIVWANPVSANIAWWDFLEELSGPGPWGMAPVQTRIWCADTSFKNCLVDSPKSRSMVVLAGAYGSTLKGDPFSMISGDVTYTYRVSRLLDVGTGIGFTTFYRDGFSLNQAVLLPASITVAPLSLISPKLRFLKFKVDEVYYTKGFVGEGWNTGSEFKTRIGFVLDIPAMFSFLTTKQ